MKARSDRKFATDARRTLPAVDAILRNPRIERYGSYVSPEILAAVVRAVLADSRQRIAEGNSAVPVDGIVDDTVAAIEALVNPRLKRVINATGIVLHTGLGRAPLSENARKAVIDACGYCDLEFDLVSGERGDRQNHLEPLLKVLTGADAALVVNNNAAALYITLNVLAFRREVVVSRGQLIEIGGSFRLPDIMARSGVKLVEVGTTNRTRVDDYRRAITPKTALLLRAHPSNYRMSGFTESVTIENLAKLGREVEIPVVDDLGNGLLWDWSNLGLPIEDNVRASLNAGVDLVLVSGDKVLGGPQAGIILGRADLVNRLKKSPLARVLRPEKLTLAGLSATLQDFLNRENASSLSRVWRMLTTPVSILRMRAERLLKWLRPLTEWRIIEVRDSIAEAGSGTLPAVSLPSSAVVSLPSNCKESTWASALRNAPVPVITTTRDQLVWMDLRTVDDSDESDLVESVRFVLNRGTSD